MFKYAVIFLIISLIAGAMGLTNISVIAKRISLFLFALFFLMFLAVVGMVFLLSDTLTPPPAPKPAAGIEFRHVTTVS